MAWILRIGVAAATLLMAVGTGLALVEGRLSAHPVTLAEFGSILVHGRPSAFMEAGILLLLATPMLRVLAMIGVFSRDRDIRFAAAAVAVACLLVLAALLGRG